MDTLGLDADALKSLFDAITAGNWRIAAAAVIIVIVGILRTGKLTKFLPGKISTWLSSGKGAWITAVVGGALGAAANVALAGSTWGGLKGVAVIIVNGAMTGLVAAGLVSGWKTLKPSAPAVPPPLPPAP